LNKHRETVAAMMKDAIAMANKASIQIGRKIKQSHIQSRVG